MSVFTHCKRRKIFLTVIVPTVLISSALFILDRKNFVLEGSFLFGQKSELLKADTNVSAARDWTKLDLYSLSPELESEFLSYKESQYDKRRKRVNRVCEKVRASEEEVHESAKSTRCKQGAQNCLIIIDLEDKLGYCRIPKVASSSWLIRFRMLKNKERRSNIRKETWTFWDNFQLHYDAALWWFYDNVEYAKHIDSLLSFVFFRHPLDRLVSAYFDKMVNCARQGMRPWSDISEAIIKEYRSANNTNVFNLLSRSSPVPTPSEFVRFVVSSHRVHADDLHAVNEHWRPQSSCCPMCAFDYSVYGMYEDLGEDTAYIIIKAGKKEFFELKKDLRVNDVSDFNKRQRSNFWTNVDDNLKEELKKIYWMDFEMFDYT